MSEETICRINWPFTTYTRKSFWARISDPSAIFNTVNAVQFVADTFCSLLKTIHCWPGARTGATKRIVVASTNVYETAVPPTDKERLGAKPCPTSVTSSPPRASTCAGEACEIEKGADSTNCAEMVHVRSASCWVKSDVLPARANASVASVT